MLQTQRKRGRTQPGAPLNPLIRALTRSAKVAPVRAGPCFSRDAGHGQSIAQKAVRSTRKLAVLLPRTELKTMSNITLVQANVNSTGELS